jgi:hypothetical protein
MILRAHLRSALCLIAALALAPGFACAQGLPSANQVYAGPTSGPPSAPSFRALVPADVPIGSTLDSIGSTRGSILERGASTWGIIPPGTAGLPWVSNGLGADPAYQTLTGGGIASNTVTNSNLANMGAGTIKGSVGGGSPADLTGLQAESLLQFLQSGTGAVQRTLDSWLKINGIHSTDFTASGTVNAQNAQTNVTITSGTASLAASTALFSSADCQGGTGCTGTVGNKVITVGGIGAAGAALRTTIIAFTDTQHITLGTNASTSQSGTSEPIEWGTDNTAGLQNWLNQCTGTASYCILDVGRYLVTTELTSSVPTYIVGGGLHTTEIIASDPAHGAISVTISNGNGAHLYSFRVSQYVAPTASVALVTLSGGGGNQFISKLVDMYLFGGNTALSAVNVQYLNVDRNVWLSQTNQAFFYNYTAACATGIGKIENTFIAPLSGGNGLNFSSEGGFTIINNDISTQGSQSGTGINFNSGSACAGGDVYIDNNNLENWSVGVQFSKGSSTGFAANHITNNDFFNNAQSLQLGDVSASWMSDTSVTGNQFYCVTTCVAATNSITNLSIVGNTFANMGGTPMGINISGNAVTGLAEGNTFTGMTTNVSNSSPKFLAESLLNGHRKAVGPAPSLGTCTGGSIAAGSTDESGFVTFTNTDTSCAITFAQSYNVAPFCVVMLSTGAGSTVSATTSTTTLTAFFAAGPAGFMWQCRGN